MVNLLLCKATGGLIVMYTTVWLLCVDWSGGMHYDLNLIQHADDCNLPYLIAFAELDKGWLLSDH